VHLQNQWSCWRARERQQDYGFGEVLTLMSVFSSFVVVSFCAGGFTTVVLVSFFSDGGFTTVVLLSFFSAGGLTVVVFCSQAANKPNIDNRQMHFFIPPESYPAAIRSPGRVAALRRASTGLSLWDLCAFRRASAPHVVEYELPTSNRCSLRRRSRSSRPRGYR
jgi:hypothetical protein